MLGHITVNHDGGDFRCPHCDKPLSVEWDTEYGDAMDGTFRNEECPACHKTFDLEVSVMPVYQALKN